MTGVFPSGHLVVTPTKRLPAIRPSSSGQYGEAAKIKRAFIGPKFPGGSAFIGPLLPLVLVCCVGSPVVGSFVRVRDRGSRE
jgi:hypothetical protein